MLNSNLGTCSAAPHLPGLLTEALGSSEVRDPRGEVNTGMREGEAEVRRGALRGVLAMFCKPVGGGKR